MNGSLGLSVGWGLCLFFAAQLGFGISGAHLNPAISFYQYTVGSIPFMWVIWYSIAQTAAGFTGALLTFVYYYDKIQQFDGGIRTVVGPNATAGIFATYPGDHLTFIGSVVDQTVCTAVMCIIVGVITDERQGVPKWAQPAMIGTMLVTVMCGFGLNSGNAMNPARDFGPRLFTFVAGYGWDVFSYRDYNWFLVPVICPMIGALLGSYLYNVTISVQIPDVGTSTASSQMNLLASIKTISTTSSSTKSPGKSELMPCWR
ncbi:Protein AQP-3 [Aphelenchoides avenae]|nr:Protein AQP-3 [Aphelenchus avenae]